MTNIYLKYGTYSGTTLTWSASQLFSALQFVDYVAAARKTTQTMRGVNVVNQSFTRSEWDVVISADQLATAAKLTFIKAFFMACEWKFSLDNWTTETVVVVDEADRIPIELIEGNKNLKEIKMKFIQKTPDA